MKIEHLYAFIVSLWAAFVTVIVIYLYKPNFIFYQYWYVSIGVFTIVFYCSFSKSPYIQRNKRIFLEDCIFIGIFLIYNLIIFSISRKSFRENFILYAIPFLILAVALILYRRKKNKVEGQDERRYIDWLDSRRNNNDGGENQK